jgi:hypothetical protein
MVLFSARSSAAITVPIPVRFELTRSISLNLLTRRTVLGQPHSGNQRKSKDRMRPPYFIRFFTFESPRPPAG